MFNFIKKAFKLHHANNNKQSPQPRKKKVSASLKKNKEYIQNKFKNCSDIAIREVKIGNNPDFTAMIVYIGNITTSSIIENTIIRKLTLKYYANTYDPKSLEYCKYLLGIQDNSVYSDIDTAIEAILAGNIAIFIDGLNLSMSLDIKNPPGRNVEEPNVETVVRGPRDGFTESLATNLVLLRKRIKSTHLKTESFILGRETKTNVTIVYLSNIAKEKTVDELKERLKKIDVDAIIVNNYIKEYIEDEPLWGIPSIYATERPDVVTTKILSGRIAIVTDGTPLVLTVPAIFMEFLINNEDFYLNFITATIIRWLRYLSFIMSLTLPGFFLAITTFHQELIPTPLLVSFIKARSSVPYPALLECFLLLVVYEMLREAGLRMPKAVGQAISIVGALVLGQAAVDAGLVSTPMVIVVATTAIAAYSVPSTDMYEAMLLPRFILLFLGGTLGLLGLICGILIFIIKLISIRSFGVPYMEPLAPIIKSELPDVIMRRPIWSKLKRSWFITGKKSTHRKGRSYINTVTEDIKKLLKKIKNGE
ncbi:spore germination protein [Clostridium hydrogenum]|uniref:spore germination protein n=1 Tax=Clostridium hydrogenum TaxID=2855764 RepID=UPI001F1CF056|nr:spore germination protein [Clostridium hydrogenum]